MLRSSQVTEIRPDEVLLESSGKALALPNHYVFTLIGGESPEEFLHKTGIEIVEKQVSTT